MKKSSKVMEPLELLKLPDLVIQLICGQLSHEDVQNLRVTCKALKELIDRRTPESLYVFVKSYPFERELCHTGERINYANSLHVSELDILKSPKFKSHFSGLLKLHLYSPSSWTDFKTVDLNDLNCFVQLVHLELHGLVVENESLSLPNLKVAFLENGRRDLSVFKLNCPRLEALGLKWRIQPTLTEETGHSIRHLHLDEAHKSKGYLLLWYPKLPNLCSICFKGRTASLDLDNFVRTVNEYRVNVPSLKKIQLKETGGFYDRGVFDTLRTLKSRYETKHIDFLINWKSMSCDELTQMLDLLEKVVPPKPPLTAAFYFSIPERSVLRHFTEQPILDCLLPGVDDLRLLSDEDVTYGKQLIGKLKNLTSLSFGNGIVLEDEFIECALRTCRRIWCLHIECCSLKQSQLDRMPDYFQNLRLLYLEKDLSLGNYNLDFVTRFKNLFYLHLQFNIDKETMRFLFQNCNHQPNFDLAFSWMQNIWISGQRNRNGRFELIQANQRMNGRDSPSNKKTEFDSIEDSIDFYYSNDLFNTPIQQK